MKKLLLYTQSLFLVMALATACSDEDAPGVLPEDWFGMPEELEISNLSSSVTLTMDVHVKDATTAKISFDGEVLDDAAPIQDGTLSVTYTAEELGLSAIDDVAPVKIEAGGYTTYAVFTMVSSLEASPAETFTALEGKTLNDTIVFETYINSWMDPDNLSYGNAEFKKGVNGAWGTFSTVEVEDGAALLVFKTADLTAKGLAPGDTVYIREIVSYSAKKDTLVTSFVYACDEFAESSEYSFTVDNVITDFTPANGVTKTDSTRIFVGLSGTEYTIEEVVDALDVEPVLAITTTGAIAGLSGYTFAFATATEDDFENGNRHQVQSASFASATPTITPTATPAYYIVKISKGSEVEYYGVVEVCAIGISGIGEIQLSVKYGAARDYDEE
ncbi:MAG: hypothetical protein LBR06_03755 [Bacteroidales bacterium]|jgi:hypothetical protein|nr:hypothetical protein [Bacteroidales bacterium]